MCVKSYRCGGPHQILHKYEMSDGRLIAWDLGLETLAQSKASLKACWREGCSRLSVHGSGVRPRYYNAAEAYFCWQTLVFFLDSFTVSLHSTNDRHLPVIRAVQGDCQPLKNGGNSHQLLEPTMHCGTRQSQTIFRPTNHERVMSANRRPRLIPHWQSWCH